MLSFLKGIYQTFFVRAPLWYCRLVVAKKNQLTLVQKRLSGKKYRYNPNSGTKIFLVYSVINWEKNFTEQWNKRGECKLFTWPDLKSYFPDRKSWRVYHNRLNNDLVSSFDEFYDPVSNFIIFFYTADLFISDKTLSYINSHRNTLLISFCWDDLLYFKDKVKGQPLGISRLSQYTDINLTMSPETIVRYNRRDSPCFFWESMPLINAVIPELPVPKYDEFYVLFIGSKYGWRRHFIERLQKKGVPVRCYGSGWANGHLTDEAMKEAIQKAPVTLGFANAGYTKTVTTIKGRDFEVPLFGGLYLTQYSPGIAKYYSIGQEVLTYSNFTDCLQMINAVKNNRDWAFAVRKKGFERAHRFATWDSRFLFLDNLLNTARANSHQDDE